MTQTRRFDASIKTITQERGADYGHPLDDFARAALISRAVQDCPDAEVRHALTMIGVKIARLCTTPNHLDSCVDIAGYARTIMMIADERKIRSAE